jgi:hypothetical protein
MSDRPEHESEWWSGCAEHVYPKRDCGYCSSKFHRLYASLSATPTPDTSERDAMSREDEIARIAGDLLFNFGLEYKIDRQRFTEQLRQGIESLRVRQDTSGLREGLLLSAIEDALAVNEAHIVNERSGYHMPVPGIVPKIEEFYRAALARQDTETPDRFAGWSAGPDGLVIDQTGNVDDPDRYTETRPHHDPNHLMNGPEYHTGKPCIEKGCDEPAGTAWSPLWCQRHNAERLDRISGRLTETRPATENER